MTDLALEKTYKMMTIGKPKTDEALRHVKLFDNVLTHDDVGGSGQFNESAQSEPPVPAHTYVSIFVSIGSFKGSLPGVDGMT